jgi:hypothetical protein
VWEGDAIFHPNAALRANPTNSTQYQQVFKPSSANRIEVKLLPGVGSGHQIKHDCK